MNRKRRMENARQAKDRKMKKIAIGGAVLLAVVLAFEVPKVLKSGGSSSSTPPAATTTGTATTAVPTTAPGTAAATVTPAAPGTAAAAVTPAASTKLPNSDLQPNRSKSQLYSFSHFAAKDPFVQQVSVATQGASTAVTSATSAAPSSGAGSGSTANSAPQQKPTRMLAATGAVRIAVNGRIETVRVGASFPSSNPLFKLVGVVHGVARIGIADGSYSSGAGTISLGAGRTLTLVDTADGIRYKIRLLSGS